MIAEKNTLLARLRSEMKESPLPAPCPQKVKYPFLADGYERQTDEEPMVMTEKYIHRKSRTALRIFLMALGIAFAVFAVLKIGIIKI